MFLFSCFLFVSEPTPFPFKRKNSAPGFLKRHKTPRLNPPPLVYCTPLPTLDIYVDAQEDSYTRGIGPHSSNFPKEVTKSTSIVQKSIPTTPTTKVSSASFAALSPTLVSDSLPFPRLFLASFYHTNIKSSLDDALTC